MSGTEDADEAKAVLSQEIAHGKIAMFIILRVAITALSLSLSN